MISNILQTFLSIYYLVTYIPILFSKNVWIIVYSDTQDLNLIPSLIVFYMQYYLLVLVINL